jgi:hypothetical protein
VVSNSRRWLASLAGFYRRYRAWRLGQSGKTAADVHTARVLSGQAWEDYCDTIRAAGAALVYGSAAPDPLDQAEGIRYLARLVRGGLEGFLEHADPAFPELRRMVHETVKLGADNPDNHYFSCRVSAEHQYRLVGTRGTVFYLGLATQRADYLAGGEQCTGLLEGEELVLDADGRLEVHIGLERPAGVRNWLPMTADSRILLVRQTFLDRASEQPADLRVERIGAAPQPGPLDCQRVDEGLAAAGMFVTGSALFFARWAEQWRAHTNELPRHPPEISLAAGGDPNIAYYHSAWRLRPDECLLVEFTPPDCPYWNFQLNNRWLESLDYRYFSIATNKHAARVRPDGSVRLVVAHRDPGVENWIDTAGHRRGTMSLRWVRARQFPAIRCRVRKLAELGALDSSEPRQAKGAERP